MMKLRGPASFFAFLLAVACILFPTRLKAQLVGDGASPTNQQTPAATERPAAKSVPISNAPTGKLLLSKDFTLEGAKVWTDTGITLEPGQRITLSAEGKLRYSDVKADNGPEGLTRGFKDLIRILPFNDAGRGAFIGKIGDPDIAQPFLIGAKKEIVSPISGKLFIGINQATSDTGDGSYKVKIEVYAADNTTPREIAKVVPTMPGVDNALFSKIPRRISDKDGNPGDMVNFLILGTEDSMKKVFTTAGWVKVDTSVESTILLGAIASLSKEAYLTMPMSPLYLFDRPQDYGWAHAEPITVLRAITCVSGRLPSLSMARCSGSALPPTTSGSRKINATTASLTKSILTLTWNATTSKKLFPPPASSPRSATSSRKTP